MLFGADVVDLKRLHIQVLEQLAVFTAPVSANADNFAAAGSHPLGLGLVCRLQ
jgi:hypothetical protein